MSDPISALSALEPGRLDPWQQVGESVPGTRNAREAPGHGQTRRLWTSAETQAPIRGSRWAAFRAITEYLDHFTPAKNDFVRANRVLTSHDVAKKKQAAYNLLAA